MQTVALKHISPFHAIVYDTEILKQERIEKAKIYDRYMKKINKMKKNSSSKNEDK